MKRSWLLAVSIAMYAISAEAIAVPCPSGRIGNDYFAHVLKVDRKDYQIDGQNGRTLPLERWLQSDRKRLDEAGDTMKVLYLVYWQGPMTARTRDILSKIEMRGFSVATNCQLNIPF